MSGIKTLVSAAGARSLDREAQEQWGLDAFALVEAAGRACAEVFVKNIIGEKREALSFAVFAGSGNNAADALVMLKALLLRGYAEPSACAVFCTRLPEGERNPFGEAVLAIRRLGVAVNAWEAETTFAPNAPAPNAPAHTALARACFIIDGITGTGLSAPLHGTALEMAQAINNALQGRVISIDLPSGNFDLWQPGMPAVQADITLAIEPQKLCLYAPSARPLAGKILPVEGIFPPALMAKYGEAELAVWEGASARIPPVPETAHKYTRGLVEIKAGSPGATGAAVLAALGAQAAGAGLVRLIVDPAVYPVVAPACSGVMAVPGGAAGDGRFHPAAVLLGPGWGRGEDRMRLLENALLLEEQGIPLILDADAIWLAKDIVFHGNAVLTPHPGEMAAYTGIPKDQILSGPVPILRRFAREKKAYILFKSHVMYAVSPSGSAGVIDGMNPLLAAGGCGDVLAGFCAAIAARLRPFDGYACACAAAALLVRAAEAGEIKGRFADPAEIAHAASAIAGNAWLPGKQSEALHER